MAGRWTGDKSLSEPMLIYCRVNPMEQNEVTFQLKFKYFHSRKCIAKWQQLKFIHFHPKKMHCKMTAILSRVQCVEGCVKYIKKLWLSAGQLNHRKMVSNLPQSFLVITGSICCEFSQKTSHSLHTRVTFGVSLTHWPLGYLNGIWKLI